MGYNYSKYIDDLEKYCSSNSEMSHNIKELKKIISTMNDKLKKLCIGFTKEDYTREEIKKMDEDKIYNLFSSIIESAKNIYFKCNGKDNNIYISGFYFKGIDFHDDIVELIYERFACDEYIYVFLTEDEFFNEDSKLLLNRMEEEYKEKKIAKEKKKEYDKKKEIEYLKKRLKELTEE